MVELNGNVPKLNFGLSIGIIVMMGIGIVVGGLFINDTKVQSEENNRQIDELDKKVNTFIDSWQKRVQIGNSIQNLTQHRLVVLIENQTNMTQLQNEQEEQLLNIAKNQSSILDKQVANEKNILGNLTRHRIVTNSTNDIIEELLNKTLNAESYGKLADQRTNDIIGNITENRKQSEENAESIAKIMDALNVTSTEHKPTFSNDTNSDINLELLRNLLLNRTS